jgi:hypothetical protein
VSGRVGRSRPSHAIRLSWRSVRCRPRRRMFASNRFPCR